MDRPISLMYIVTKIYVRFLHRIMSWVIENCILAEGQCGKRHGHSIIIISCFVLNQLIPKYINNGKQLLPAFIDFGAAPNTVEEFYREN